MRVLALLAGLVPLTAAVVVDVNARAEDAAAQLFTIETAPGVTQQVTEAEKWSLLKQGINFMDITHFPIPDANTASTSSLRHRAPAVTYPSSMTQTTTVNGLIKTLSTANMESNLKNMAAFYNRYYQSSYGTQAAAWLLSLVKTTVAGTGAGSAVTVSAFNHTGWNQPSVIVKIPGKSAKVIVVGAHFDSINMDHPSDGKAPGADDNGSGAMGILEALRAVLTNSTVAAGKAENSIEFHFYAAEEGGLLGSQDIFQKYSATKVDVRAMLCQDMTGYFKKGSKEVLAVVTDFVDSALTAYLRKLIAAYSTLPSVDEPCGYACSDHGSATKYGYPSAIMWEALAENSLQVLHTEQDTLDKVSYSHMLEHVKVVVGFVVELAFAKGL